LYPYAWSDDPIVAGLVADSGSPGIAGSVDTAQSNFTFLAGLVGCGNLSASAEVDCMRGVDAQKLENALSWYSSNGTKPSIAFGPIPDGKVVFANYTTQAQQGKVAKTVSTILCSLDQKY
jgi:hypothetical protein